MKVRRLRRSGCERPLRPLCLGLVTCVRAGVSPGDVTIVSTFTWDAATSASSPYRADSGDLHLRKG